MRISRAQITGIILGLIALALWFLFSWNMELAEHLFARRIYPFIAGLLSWPGNLIPFAITGLIISGFSLWLIWIPVREFRNRKKRWLWIAPSGLSVLSTSGALFFFTSITFLLNHHRYPEEKLYGLDFEFDKTAFEKVVSHSLERANEISQHFPEDERACSDIGFSLDEFDSLIKKEQKSFLGGQGLPALSTANTRYFLFSEIWSGMGISGQYQPLIAQPNIARAIPEFSKPFVLAHERAHLNGFASEAGANLLALQTLLHAQDPGLNYLALLEMWRKYEPEGMNERVKRDVQCWTDDWNNMHRFEFDYISRKINDFYLKAAGHEDGVESYGRGKLLGLKYYYKNFVDREIQSGEIKTDGHGVPNTH